MWPKRIRFSTCAMRKNTRIRYHQWLMLPYLVGADVVNTALSAFLAFCGRPVYSYYIEHPNGFGILPMPDQVTGAVIMWVIGSLVFLVPAVLITFRLLQQDSKLVRLDFARDLASVRVAEVNEARETEMTSENSSFTETSRANPTLFR